MCCRCKRPMPLECPGLPDCNFDSNCFIGKKSNMLCCMCEQPVECGVHLVTKMIRGPYQGRYPHMKCAAAWYEQNPKPPPIIVSQSSNELKFMMPKPEIVEFLDKFVRGEKRKFAIKGTAGSGKSNALVLAVRECRKAKLSILVLVFSVKAKEELLSRGLKADECSNFHAFFLRAYERWVVATLREHVAMATTSSMRGSTTTALKPTVCVNKIRLLVAFHVRHEEGADARTTLLRPFVSELANYARGRGFGGSGPSVYDEDALSALVSKYNVDKKLEMTWSVRLVQPQKLTIDRVVGVGPEARLKYAITATSHVLDLARLTAVSTSVEGVAELINEVSREAIRLPIIDFADMASIIDSQEIDCGKYDRLLLDEAQDVQDVTLFCAAPLVKRNGSMLVVGDESQAIFQWSGVNTESHAKFVMDAEIYELADNYRCGREIVKVAQKFLDVMGNNMKINPMRDVDGQVIYGSFHDLPIDVSVTTLVLLRTSAHATVFFHVLKGKGYPACLHSTADIVPSYKKLLGVQLESLASVRRRMSSYIECNVPDAEGGDFELKEGLVALIDIYCGADIAGPAAAGAIDSKRLFTLWLEDFFRLPSGRVPIVVSTMHSAKGLEATVVYIGNPFLCPLPERIAAGGWQKHEELCVAFVAHTRARDVLCFLPNLESTTRASVLTLWEPPVENQKMPVSSSQVETSATEAAEINHADNSDDETNGDMTDSRALRLLGLKVVPGSRMEIETAVRTKLAVFINNDAMRKAILQARAHAQRMANDLGGAPPAPVSLEDSPALAAQPAPAAPTASAALRKKRASK